MQQRSGCRADVCSEQRAQSHAAADVEIFHADRIDGCIEFKTCVADLRRPLGDGGYHGQIEAFAVYCPQTGSAYLVPINDVPGPTMARLRLDPTRNGQIHGVRWARDYELTADRVIALIGRCL